ncbi:synaptic vesicle membrane protein VAT-1 homolog-like isoform X3 [Centruroides sculpturatus]|uniref:synaptic vesicle membrane protein VAT-1 homolog-like isoform X3 n=1 Tax=Centruroides sculpturatus TaxID=218467 RepID=UPI000C6D1EBF|nr:synaptic vesicle membrane protein VAT-1 homolog-like isoform X3 [Centruroides sculpturatus]
MADTNNAEQEKAEEVQNAEEQKQESTPPPKEMKAVVLTGFGGLKSVKVMKKPEPTAKEGEVLIRVKSGGLNFLDVMVRQGVLDNPVKTPFIMGFECAGVIESLGENVTDFQVGDEVAALSEYKAWAELTAVPAKFVYKLPPGMSFQDASALLLNNVVAYILLFEVGNLREGNTILMHSAGGGVGQAVAQMAKMIPNITLIGTASKHKHEDIKSSVTHLIDHGVDYVQEVKKLSPEGVDLVLDCLCGEDVNKGYSLLKPLGRYILYGSSSIVTGETKSFFSITKSWWQVDKVNPIKLFDENKSISGFNLRHLLYQQGGHEYIRGIVEKVFRLWKEGKIKTVIDSTWAFEDVPEAMQRLHDRKNVGKITLDPNMEPKPKPQPTKGKEKEAKDGKATSVPSGESTDTEKEAKEESSPPPNSS